MHGHFKGEVKGDETGFYVNGRKIHVYAAMQIKVCAVCAVCGHACDERARRDACPCCSAAKRALSPP